MSHASLILIAQHTGHARRRSAVSDLDSHSFSAATPHTAGTPPNAAPEPTPQQQQQQRQRQRITVRLPSRWMNRPDAHPAQASGEPPARDDDESEQDNSDEEANAPLDQYTTFRTSPISLQGLDLASSAMEGVVVPCLF